MVALTASPQLTLPLHRSLISAAESDDVRAVLATRLEDVPDSTMTVVVAVAFLSVSTSVLRALSADPRFAVWCSKRALFPLVCDFETGSPFPVPCSTYKFVKRAFLSGGLGHMLVLICVRGRMASGHPDVVRWALRLAACYKHRTALTALVKATKPSPEERNMALRHLLAPPPMMSLDGKIPIRMDRAVRDLLGHA